MEVCSMKLVDYYNLKVFKYLSITHQVRKCVFNCYLEGGNVYKLLKMESRIPKFIINICIILNETRIEEEE